MIMRFHATRLLGALSLVAMAGAVVPTAPALGEAIFLTAPAEMSRIELPETAPPSAAPADVAPAPTPVPETTVGPETTAASETTAGPRRTVLRHLGNHVQGYRLSGEVGASEWPMYLTARQARRKLQFQLGYLAAVSVMPEASRLTLFVNDQPVGATVIAAVQTVKTVVFDIPPGLLRPGFNSLRVKAEQRHRVDCSLEATYELWTQIDPTQTGLLLDESDAAVDSLADLGALPTDEQGALPLRVVPPARPGPRDMERMLRVVQLISIIGRFEQPVVDTGPLAGGGYGANLLVGTAAELAAVAGPQMVGVVDGPRAFVLPATPERRTTIVVTGADARQVDEAIKTFLVAARPTGAEAGLRAAQAFPGYRVEGGQRIRLSDIGVTSAEFAGRLFRVAFNIVMPSDFYPADYGRAMVRVAGGYAPGLTSKAQLVMYVNERTAVSLPLLKSTGDVFQDNPLPLPLGFLRPGLNRIEIEAHVPAPTDAACDTLAAGDAQSRFLFLDSTEIEIPAIARVGRLPDLAVTATGGFPFAGSRRRARLYMPRLEPGVVDATATFVAHLAVVAGRPIDFEVTQTPPLSGGRPILAVAPFDAFDPELLRKLDMPADDLARAWRGKIGVASAGAEPERSGAVDTVARNHFVLQNNFPMACRSRKSLGGLRAMLRKIDTMATGAIDESGRYDRETDPRAEPEGGADLLQQWDARFRTENRLVAAVQKLRELGERARAKFTDAGNLFRFDATPAAAVSQTTTLALGQNLLDGASDNVWTVLTAANAQSLSESVACLVDPRVSRQIAGKVSLLELSKAKIESVPATTMRFVVTQPLSLGNARLIAAGWLSLHSLYYVGAALVVGLLLALSTHLFVKTLGRRSA